VATPQLPAAAAADAAAAVASLAGRNMFATFFGEIPAPAPAPSPTAAPTPAQLPIEVFVEPFELGNLFSVLGHGLRLSCSGCCCCCCFFFSWPWDYFILCVSFLALETSYSCLA